MKRIITATLTAAILTGGGFALAQVGADFSDVLDDHEHATGINYAWVREWINGYPDGTFRPDQTIPEVIG